MAKHWHHRTGWWTYRFWPISLPTPRWFDEAPWAMGAWAWLRSRGLIRASRSG